MPIDELGGPTSQLLNLMLDAALKRHEVIANNIANVGTPGYRAKTYNFDAIVERYAFAGSEQVSTDDFDEDFARLRDSLGAAESLAESDVEQVKLDEQIIQLTENVVRYQALLEAASKRGAIMKLAISGGR